MNQNLANILHFQIHRKSFTQVDLNWKLLLPLYFIYNNFIEYTEREKENMIFALQVWSLLQIWDINLFENLLKNEIGRLKKSLELAINSGEEVIEDAKLAQVSYLY